MQITFYRDVVHGPNPLARPDILQVVVTDTYARWLYKCLSSDELNQYAISRGEPCAMDAQRFLNQIADLMATRKLIQEGDSPDLTLPTLAALVALAGRAVSLNELLSSTSSSFSIAWKVEA